MNYETAIEHVKVICAPPGSTIVFIAHMDAVWMREDIERLRATLPEYTVILVNGIEDIRAIVPVEPPPVTNNYIYNAGVKS